MKDVKWTVLEPVGSRSLGKPGKLVIVQKRTWGAHNNLRKMVSQGAKLLVGPITVNLRQFFGTSYPRNSTNIV